MSDNISIKTGVSGDDQMSSMMNASLHIGPSEMAVSIDTEAAFPDGVETEAQIKAHLEKELEPLARKGWKFTIEIGPDS